MEYAEGTETTLAGGCILEAQSPRIVSADFFSAATA